MSDTILTLPPVTAIRAYMRAVGWTESGHGSHGSVFTKGPVKVSVPHEDDDPDAVRMALYRLAVAEGRQADETAAAVLAYRELATPTKPCGCGPLEPCAPHLQHAAETDAEGRAVAITDEHVRTAFTAVMDYQKQAREAMWSCPSTGQIRAMLEAAAPVLRKTWLSQIEPGGEIVREAWVYWALEQPDAAEHPNWLKSWAEMDERDREADDRIYAAVAAHAAVAVRERAERAEAELAEVRETVTAFRDRYADSLDTQAADLACAVLRVANRTTLAVAGGQERGGGKLVRDRIPDLIRSQGLEPVTRAASPAEYRVLLRDKLQEEAGEYLASGDPGELADVLEVVYALAGVAGVPPGGLEGMRAAKAEERGGFGGRVVWCGNRERGDEKGRDRG